MIEARDEVVFCSLHTSGCLGEVGDILIDWHEESTVGAIVRVLNSFLFLFRNFIPSVVIVRPFPFPLAVFPPRVPQLNQFVLFVIVDCCHLPQR